MAASAKTEYWLQGHLQDVPDLLQPVAHTLLQARDEVGECMKGFPEDRLWERPAGSASPAFHLQHLAGVLDRLLTYARGQQLNQQQLDQLAAEGKENETIDLAAMLGNFYQQVEKAITQLKNTDPGSLLHTRGVGRKLIPSTVIGLLFHAAEHTMRHTGQLLVTVKILT